MPYAQKRIMLSVSQRKGFYFASVPILRSDAMGLLALAELMPLKDHLVETTTTISANATTTIAAMAATISMAS